MMTTDHLPEWSDAEIRLAIERYNGNGLAFSGDGQEINGHARFRLKRLAHMGSTVLAIGELHHTPESGGRLARPLVLAWEFGSDQAVEEIRTYESEAEAVAVLEPELSES